MRKEVLTFLSSITRKISNDFNGLKKIADVKEAYSEPSQTSKMIECG